MLDYESSGARASAVSSLHSDRQAGPFDEDLVRGFALGKFFDDPDERLRRIEVELRPAAVGHGFDVVLAGEVMQNQIFIG